MNQPTLVYGIGATKAGTSWLHIYLSAHPECYMRAVKELHYFDTLNRPQWREQKPLQKILGLIAKRKISAKILDGGSDRQLTDFTEWQAMMLQSSNDHRGYITFLEKDIENQKIIGDVTPAYGLLSAERLSEMAALPRLTKFIYILRDPLDRLWSNVRMGAGLAGATGADLAGACSNILDRVLANDHFALQRRSDYQRSLENFDEAIDSKNLLVEFFENLFSPEALKRITDFLGISPFYGKLDKVVNAGSKLEMSGEQRLRALEWLQPQYDYIMRRFAGQVPGRWHAQLNEV